MELKLTAAVAAAGVAAILLFPTIGDQEDGGAAFSASRSEVVEIVTYDKIRLVEESPTGKAWVVKGEDSAGRKINLRIDVPAAVLLADDADLVHSVPVSAETRHASGQKCSGQKATT